VRGSRAGALRGDLPAPAQHAQRARLAAPAGAEHPGGGGSVTLEPGGQLELSGAPLPDLHAMCAELQGHLDLVGGEARAGLQWRRRRLPCPALHCTAPPLWPPEVVLQPRWLPRRRRQRLPRR
jgi:hypothetical protein